MENETKNVFSSASKKGFNPKAYVQVFLPVDGYGYVTYVYVTYRCQYKH